MSIPISSEFRQWAILKLRHAIDTECKWYVALYSQKNRVWSSKKKEEFWINLFQGDMLKIEKDHWHDSKLLHTFKLRALKPVDIDGAIIEIKNGKKLIYSRTWNWESLHMEPGDFFDLNFEINLS